jgi:hypothetical protein
MMLMVHIRFGSATLNIIYWRKNVSEKKSHFLSSTSTHRDRNNEKKSEAEKLPDKFETFHDGYTAFLIRLYRIWNRQEDRKTRNEKNYSSSQNASLAG